ncbi:MAG TPA: MFS transporter [Opitutaceae bacterium]|nr:MFS transporter [Opitutaceae bacterium]
MLVIAAGAGMVFYLDRQSIAILKSTISAALHLSNADFALLITAYLITYTAFYLFSGKLVDRMGTRNAASFFLLTMACATLGCALAGTLPEMMAARGMLGMAESGIAPSIILTMALWFPPARRAFATTVCQALQALAPVAAPPVLVWLALRGDWRLAFVAPAALSLVVAGAWWLSDRPTSESRLAWGAAPAAKLGLVEAVKLIVATPALRALIVARVLSDPFYFFLNNWYTGFLQEHAGWSLADIGRWTWIPWVFVPLANIGVAMWSDRQTRKLGDPAAARRRTLQLLACLAPAAAMAPFVPHGGPVILGLITISLLMATCWIALSGVMVSELAPAGTIATAIGVLSALSGVTSTLFNQIAGSLIDRFGYTALFVVGACLHPLAALALRSHGRRGTP